MSKTALLLLAATACTPLHARASHAADPTPDGREMHTCVGYAREPFDCEEGYACTLFGCEWCGDDDGAQTRCTWGVD